MISGIEETIHQVDVLIIGGGFAGCFAGIKARENGAKDVLLVDKAKAGKSGPSAFAAGVVPAFLPDQDDFDKWFKEVVELGEYLNDQDWLEIVIKEIHLCIKDIVKWGGDFIREPDGRFKRVTGRGGGPDRALKNIMFKGPQLMEVMRKAAVNNGVRIIDRVMVTDFLKNGNRVVGACGFDIRTGQFHVFHARVTVLCSGATYSKGNMLAIKNATGDAHRMAFEAGARLMNFDLISENNFSLEFDLLGMHMFAGLGGRLINARGEEFAHHYDPVLGSRTSKPRMNTAQALEVMRGRGPIYMDMTHFPPDKIDQMRLNIPLAVKILERAGILVNNTIVKKMLWGPSGPGSIAFGGGAKVDTECRTSLEGLFAAGDAAAKMAAGCNEVGGGALCWAMTSGARAGRFAAHYASGTEITPIDQDLLSSLQDCIYSPMSRKTGVEPDHVTLRVQETIIPCDVLIVRHGDRLKKAIEKIEEIKATELPYLHAGDSHQLMLANEAKSFTLCAELYLRSGLLREESRCNLREDFPDVDNIHWLKWVGLEKEGTNMKFHLLDIPMDRYKYKPERKKFRHPFFLVRENEHVA
jgi:succinate dehydrogenase/fumarate reductase flavoprotein subunit